MSKIESETSGIDKSNNPTYSNESLVAWLCIDIVSYRKLKEYVVKQHKNGIYDPKLFGDLDIRKAIANKQIKLKDNGIHNQIKEYLDNLPDYHTWFTLIWSNNPDIVSEDSEGNSYYPLKQNIDDLFNLIKV